MDNKSLENGIYQFIIWCLILGLIAIRTFVYRSSAQWIWVINYAGMFLALLNLLLNKCIKLRSNKHPKYKPFKGLTICIILVSLLLLIPVLYIQETDYATYLNDIITLFALFFSLPPSTWDFILEKIISIIH